MMSCDFLSWGSADLWALSLFLIAVLWYRYTAARNKFSSYEKRDNANSYPLTFPYVFPVLGTLPISYLWRPRAFVLNPSSFFQSVHPVRIRLLTYEFYVIRGSENVKTLFKRSWACTPIPFVKFALGYAFGLPAKALSLYDQDDSGGGHVPHQNSTVESRNRVDYRAHQSLIQLLEGNGLVPFWNRFADNITQQLCKLHDSVGPEWDHRADLMTLVGDEISVSTLNALCGPYLLSLNPNFLSDYWSFDRNLQTYLQGVPWVFAPKAYAARKRVLNAVKTWQQHARDHYHDSVKDSGGDDPYWGSSFFRNRQDMFLEMDGFDYDAIASADFGLIWAARNSITAASWTTFELYRDPELLASVREEVDACVLTDADDHIRFDLDKLLRLPVLQAVYAETLRLRMHFYIIRMPDKADMEFRDWVIPRRKVIVTPTTVAHFDSEAWNTGLNNEHPLDQFWIGRFLKYPSTSVRSSSRPGDSASTVTFSTKDLEGSWIPYGGGPRQCPGRHFSKRQILLTTALMISLFDCEIIEEGRNVKEDLTLKGFGGGVSHPVGKVPISIRRRNRNVM
ncbi:cytochrome P450 [Truncatella angustata]|uniref:Cytochrome P450 n=1 Tax=Truncatella angustata TaxID=152316 RepID=A0A9P8RL84_9PEZI|nr:cytochrome P450 [Truncatella angustata]KAH6646126.1 cytochrome P450 [Truncatella angustata]